VLFFHARQYTTRPFLKHSLTAIIRTAKIIAMGKKRPSRRLRETWKVFTIIDFLFCPDRPVGFEQARAPASGGAVSTIAHRANQTETGLDDPPIFGSIGVGIFWAFLSSSSNLFFPDGAVVIAKKYNQKSRFVNAHVPFHRSVI
jgi:hypothetical protein